MWLNCKSMLGVNCVTQVEGDGSHPVVEHRADDGLVLWEASPQLCPEAGYLAAGYRIGCLNFCVCV